MPGLSFPFQFLTIILVQNLQIVPLDSSISLSWPSKSLLLLKCNAQPWYLKGPSSIFVFLLLLLLFFLLSQSDRLHLTSEARNHQAQTQVFSLALIYPPPHLTPPPNPLFHKSAFSLTPQRSHTIQPLLLAQDFPKTLLMPLASPSPMWLNHVSSLSSHSPLFGTFLNHCRS